MIAVEHDHWIVFRQIPPAKLITTLKDLSAKVRLSAYRKHPRGPKKPQPKRVGSKSTPHVSTAKIIGRKKIEVLP